MFGFTRWPDDLTPDIYYRADCNKTDLEKTTEEDWDAATVVLWTKSDLEKGRCRCFCVLEFRCHFTNCESWFKYTTLQYKSHNTNIKYNWIYAINNINTDCVACVPCRGCWSRMFAGPYPAWQQSILSVCEPFGSLLAYPALQPTVPVPFLESAGHAAGRLSAS